MRQAIVCTLMMLLISCSGKIFKIHRINTKEARVIEIDQKLLKQTPHPEPVLLQPENCPIVVEQYTGALDNCNLKIELINKAQIKALKERE